MNAKLFLLLDAKFLLQVMWNNFSVSVSFTVYYQLNF